MIDDKIRIDILNYVKKKMDKEKDKWNSGRKNSYFRWEDAYDEIKAYFYGEEK